MQAHGQIPLVVLLLQPAEHGVVHPLLAELQLGQIHALPGLPVLQGGADFRGDADDIVVHPDDQAVGIADDLRTVGALLQHLGFKGRIQAGIGSGAGIPVEIKA